MWEGAGSVDNPPPTSDCQTCFTPNTKWGTFRTPRGRVWQCQHCLTPAEPENLAFDPRQAPSGLEQGMAAIAVLQQLVVGLRHSQEGPLDPADLYEICRPYFNGGWCVRDVIHALNQMPDTTPHPDTGWNDRLPRKQLLYRVQRRLRQWRWVDRDELDDIMPGGWSEMRHAMTVVSQRQQHHAAERAHQWTDQRRAAYYARGGEGRRAALEVASAAANQARLRRAEAERLERAATAQAAREAVQQREDLFTQLHEIGRRTSTEPW